MILSADVWTWINWLRKNAAKPVTLAPRTTIDLANLLEELLIDRDAAKANADLKGE